MRWLPLLAATSSLLAPAALALPADALEPRQQIVISSSDLVEQASGRGYAADFVHDSEEEHTGTGRLSQWSRRNKVRTPFDGLIHLAGRGGAGFAETVKRPQEDFLEALRNNDADEYIVVMGNEAGDLDSLVSAVALSFMYNHLDPPQKAVALLQTEQGASRVAVTRRETGADSSRADALDLRPENALALHYAKMSSGHRDLLSAKLSLPEEDTALC